MNVLPKDERRGPKTEVNVTMKFSKDVAKKYNVSGNVALPSLLTSTGTIDLTKQHGYDQSSSSMRYTQLTIQGGTPKAGTAHWNIVENIGMADGIVGEIQGLSFESRDAPSHVEYAVRVTDSEGNEYYGASDSSWLLRAWDLIISAFRTD